MANRKRKTKNSSSGCGFLLLLLLCLFVAVAYWKPEIPVPDPVREPAEKVISCAEQKIESLASTVTDFWEQLKGALPEREPQEEVAEPTDETESVVTMDSLPEYAGEPYVILYGNEPFFTEEERTGTRAYEVYAPLDLLNRCGVTEACIGQELMPTEERGQIGMVKPSGWHTIRYDDLVDGKYLYNRCHLIGYQLTGENANESNLITGTRYLNVEGMLPFENLVANYISETGNHVLYRVTPDFRGLEMLARGVQMEAWSVEDDGEGVCFHVYCYNVQPGVKINYLTGESQRAEETGS